MPFLRYSLRLNAATCAAFGALFTVWAAEIAKFLGAMPIVVLQWLGAALLLNSAHLLLVSLRQKISNLEISYFSGGDLLWFLASLCLVVATDWVTTAAGIIATLSVALGVAAIGLAQLWFQAEESGFPHPSSTEDASDHLPAGHSRLRAIALSWWSLPRWVKLWLFALNAVFLSGIAFWEEDVARIVLAAWIATGPPLAALMIVQRGLTRLLGVAHLVPWLPLVVYLELRLLGSVSGPKITWEADPVLFSWMLTLLAFIYVCLAFDVVDLLRWLRGEVCRIGSERDAARQSSVRAIA